MINGALTIYRPLYGAYWTAGKLVPRLLPSAIILQERKLFEKMRPEVVWERD